MKFQLKTVLIGILATLTMVSCGEDTELENTNTTNAYLDLVGTVTYRTATKEELQRIKKPVKSKSSCSLGSDADCSDTAQSSLENFVRNCTTYTRTWPPKGTVETVYKSMIYYVDSDGDINLDNYEDDLQAQVNTLGAAAYIDANIIFWQCNDTAQNSCVIMYIIYK